MYPYAHRCPPQLTCSRNANTASSCCCAASTSSAGPFCQVGHPFPRLPTESLYCFLLLPLRLLADQPKAAAPATAARWWKHPPPRCRQVPTPTCCAQRACQQGRDAQVGAAVAPAQPARGLVRRTGGNCLSGFQRVCCVSVRGDWRWEGGEGCAGGCADIRADPHVECKHGPHAPGRPHALKPHAWPPKPSPPETNMPRHAMPPSPCTPGRRRCCSRRHRWVLQMGGRWARPPALHCCTASRLYM